MIGCYTCQAHTVPENRKQANQRQTGREQTTTKYNTPTKDSDNATKNTTESGARVTPVKKAGRPEKSCREMQRVAKHSLYQSRWERNRGTQPKARNFFSIE